MENKISPSALVIWIIISLVVGGLIGYYIPRYESAYAPVSNNIINNEQVGDITPTSPTSVTRVGEYVCLPHRDTSGPQTLECAFGLQTSENVYFALNTESLPDGIPSSIETGDNIQVTGTMRSGAETDTLLDRYAIIGVIQVTSITEL